MSEQDAAIDYIAIRRLQAAYADRLNRHAWDEVCALFLPEAEIVVDRQGDAPLRLDVAGFVGFVATFVAPMDFFQFIVLNSIIDVSGDAASARLYICEVRHDARAGQTMGYALLRDHYRRIDGSWRIAARGNRVMARTQTISNAVFAMAPEDFGA